MTNTRMVSSGAILEVRSSNTVNAETTNTFKIESTNAANSHYPIFKLAKDVAGGSVVDGYKGPKMAMTCASDDGTEKEVMSINSIVSDASNALMSSDLEFKVRNNNSMDTFLSVSGSNLKTDLSLEDDDLILSSSQTNITNSPDFILRKGDTGVADNENLGTIQFEGYNNAAELVNYVSIRGEVDEVDDGVEGGRFAVDVMSSGTMKESFLINGDGLTLDAEMQQTTFRLNGFSNLSTQAPTLELNRERTNAPSANDEIGRVLFAGENADQARVEYAEIQGKIIDPTTLDNDGDGVVDGPDGRLNVSVSKAGSMTEVVGVTHNGGGAANNADTANEQKLKAVELHGTDLEVLTRRNIITFQVGENGDITNTLGGSATNHALRMANGVQSVLDTTFANSLGIVAPFAGHVIGGTFQFRYESGTQADVEMYVRRVHGAGYQDIRVAHVQNAQDDDTFYKSNTYPITSTNHRSTSFQVAAGDVLIPYIDLSSDSGTYEISDVVGQFFLYTQEIVQA